MEAGAKRHSSAMWSDPDKQVSTGILLSDRIKFYVDEVALIDPFIDENLCPASYDLTLGTDCWYHAYAKETGQAKRVLREGEDLVIPPNSIVFVSTAERLNLPFYLVARFNLKLRFLHEGLLVGTGPQVDPGFTGQLSCPLHNISSERVSLRCGESFAVIEFQKTTPFAQLEKFSTKTSLSEIRERGETNRLNGINNRPCVTFPARSLNRAPIKGYLPGGKAVASSVEGVASNIKELQDDFGDYKKSLDGNISKLQIMAFVAVAVVAVSFAGYFFSVITWHKAEHEKLENRIKLLEGKTSAIPVSTIPGTPLSNPTHAVITSAVPSLLPVQSGSSSIQSPTNFQPVVPLGPVNDIPRKAN